MNAAYQLGKVAYAAGEDRYDDNPYPVDSDDNNNWEQGWLDAWAFDFDATIGVS